MEKISDSKEPELSNSINNSSGDEFDFGNTYTYQLAERFVTQKMQKKYHQLRRKQGRGVLLLTTWANNNEEFIKMTQKASPRDLVYHTFSALRRLIDKSYLREYKKVYTKEYVMIVFWNLRPIINITTYVHYNDYRYAYTECNSKASITHAMLRIKVENIEIDRKVQGQTEMEKLESQLHDAIKYFTSSKTLIDFYDKRRKWIDQVKYTDNKLLQNILDMEVHEYFIKKYPNRFAKNLFGQFSKDDYFDISSPLFDILDKMIQLGKSRPEIAQILIKYIDEIL